MKRLLVALLIIAVLVAPTIALGASSIAGARYFGVIQVSNNSTAETYVATTTGTSINTTNLIAGGYLNAAATNAVVRSSAGGDILFQPGYEPSGYPWCIWVNSIGANTYLSDILYTANSSGGKIRYFPNIGGMTTPDDNADFELGANFTIKQLGWVDTTFPIDYEDFTTYIEVDPNNKLTVTANRAEAADADQDEDVYLYKDKGADFFNALNIDFEIYIASTSEDGCLGGIAVTNIISTLGNFVSPDMCVYIRRALGPIYTIYLARGPGDAVDTYACAADTPYYCSLVRLSGNDSAKLLIFTDSARTVQVDTLTVAGYGAAKYQYVYGFVHLNTPAADKNFDGYVQNLTLARKFLVNKEGAFTTYISADGDITSSVGELGVGGNVTASGITSGEYVIETRLSTGNLTIWVNGVERDDAVSAAVPNTSANWTFFQNDVSPYAGADNLTLQRIWIGGTLSQHIVWEYGTTFNDLSTKDNDATPSFRTASSDPDISAELISFQPISEAQAPGYVLGEAPDFIDPGITGNVTGTFTTTPGTGTFPLANVIAEIALATKTPEQLPLLIIAAFTILAFSLGISATMRRYGSGSILVKTMVIAGLMGIFVALGNFSFDFWMIVVFLVIAIAINFASKQIGWT